MTGRLQVKAFRQSIRIAALAMLCAAALHATLVRAAGVDAASPQSPAGLWKTFDDKSGAALALVRIYAEDGKLFGRIERSLTPGDERRVCAECTDERRNQPIAGLLIIRKMKATDDGFAGGDILDPDNGTVYRCKFHMDQNGSRLVVRGYIGFSLLGRTQIWQRQE